MLGSFWVGPDAGRACSSAAVYPGRCILPVRSPEVDWAVVVIGVVVVAELYAGGNNWG